MTKPITAIEDEKNRREQLKRWIDDHFDGVQARFIRACNINQGELSSLLRGAKAFGANRARTLEQTAGMPERYLEMRADNAESIELQGVFANSVDIVNIYEFDVKAAMGNGLTLPEQPGVIKQWRVNKEWVQRNLPANTGLQNLCIVTGFGDSMRPMFNPGDPLIIDMGVKTIELDATYFFRVDNEGFIKRIQRVPGIGKVVISENKSFKEWILKDNMDYEVFGRVLKVWRGEDL